MFISRFLTVAVLCASFSAYAEDGTIDTETSSCAFSGFLKNTLCPYEPENPEDMVYFKECKKALQSERLGGNGSYTKEWMVDCIENKKIIAANAIEENRKRQEKADREQQEQQYREQQYIAQIQERENQAKENQAKEREKPDDNCIKILGTGKFSISDVKTGAICNLPVYIRSDLVDQWEIELPQGKTLKTEEKSNTEVIFSFLEDYGRNNPNTLTKTMDPAPLLISKKVRKDDNLRLSIVYLDGGQNYPTGYVSSIKRTVCATDATNSLNGKNSFRNSLIEKYGKPQKEVSALVKANLLKKELEEAKEKFRDKLDKLKMMMAVHPEAGLLNGAVQMIQLEFERQERQADSLRKLGQAIVELIWEDPAGDTLTVTENHNECGESSQFEFSLENNRPILVFKDSLKAQKQKNAINAESPVL